MNLETLTLAHTSTYDRDNRADGWTLKLIGDTVKAFLDDGDLADAIDDTEDDEPSRYDSKKSFKPEYAFDLATFAAVGGHQQRYSVRRYDTDKGAFAFVVVIESSNPTGCAFLSGKATHALQMSEGDFFKPARKKALYSPEAIEALSVMYRWGGERTLAEVRAAGDIPPSYKAIFGYAGADNTEEVIAAAATPSHASWTRITQLCDGASQQTIEAAIDAMKNWPPRHRRFTRSYWQLDTVPADDAVFRLARSYQMCSVSPDEIDVALHHEGVKATGRVLNFLRCELQGRHMVAVRDDFAAQLVRLHLYDNTVDDDVPAILGETRFPVLKGLYVSGEAVRAGSWLDDRFPALQQLQLDNVGDLDALDLSVWPELTTLTLKGVDGLPTLLSDSVKTLEATSDGALPASLLKLGSGLTRADLTVGADGDALLDALDDASPSLAEIVLRGRSYTRERVEALDHPAFETVSARYVNARWEIKLQRR